MAKHITVSDLNCDLSYIPIPPKETKYEGQNVFRKILDTSRCFNMVEIEIAKRIMLNPKPNVVRVFDVVKTAKECYIDMEQLDVEDVTWGKCILDVMNGLAQLHTLDVVYIDVKEDNVGYSHVDGAYKLFDFNCSGVISSKDKMTWLYRPYKEGFTYKNVRTHEYTLASLCTLDDIIILDIANRLMKGITR